MRRLAAATVLAVLLSAAGTASALSGVTTARASATIAARLAGTFTMRGRITVADNVRGEHTGQRITRTWTFYPQCQNGACSRVVLKRRRSSRGILNTVTLDRRSAGVYSGRGRFSVPLKCDGQVRPHGGVANERITVRITRAARAGGMLYATGISASYDNPSRHQHTRCPGTIGHDGATYTGTLAVKAIDATPNAGYLGWSGRAFGALAISPITGNPEGIRLAHQVMRAFTRISVFKQSEQHFFQIRYEPKKRQFAYLFGKPSRSGYVWANEKSTIGLHRNRVVWWLDALAPVSGHRSPVVIALNKSGRYTAFGTPSKHTCFTNLPSTSMLPYRYGGLGYSIGGRMEKPQAGPTTVLLPYVYRWELNLTADETDTISKSTKLVLSGKVNITRHSGESVLSFVFTNAYPLRQPRAPTVNLCSA